MCTMVTFSTCTTVAFIEQRLPLSKEVAIINAMKVAVVHLLLPCQLQGNQTAYVYVCGQIYNLIFDDHLIYMSPNSPYEIWPLSHKL